MTPRQEWLCADIDLRLESLWRVAFEVEHWELPLVGEFMRCAYGHGHRDALIEPDPRRLYLDHGYGVPQKRSRR